MLGSNKPKSTGNLLEYLIEQSFVGTIVKDGLDLATLRGNILNRYDIQIVEYFRSIGSKTDTYPILLLCFYMALSRVIKIKNDQLDTKISEVQDSSDQANLYYYLVMFRPFFLFHIIYSKLESQDNSDYKVFFEENDGFINELYKRVVKNKKSKARRFCIYLRGNKVGSYPYTSSSQNQRTC